MPPTAGKQPLTAPAAPTMDSTPDTNEHSTEKYTTARSGHAAGAYHHTNGAVRQGERSS